MPPPQSFPPPYLVKKRRSLCRHPQRLIAHTYCSSGRYCISMRITSMNMGMEVMKAARNPLGGSGGGGKCGGGGGGGGGGEEEESEA